ncbi:MAG: rhodanese-like domain-containing protein [Planctomycetota bacterium]
MDPFRITRIACALLVALTLATVSCEDSRRSDQPQPMATVELVERIRADSAPLVLDVRTRREYAAGHIPGAVNIPYDELPGRLDELDGDKTVEVVVYCQTGQRAVFAEDALARAGYTKVRDLEGHMRAWRRARYPIR